VYCWSGMGSSHQLGLLQCSAAEAAALGMKRCIIGQDGLFSSAGISAVFCS
jgi:hypothetical protein